MKKKMLALKKFLLKIPWLIAGNVFISGLFVFFIAFILSGFLFYKHAILAEEEEVAAPNPFLQIDKSNYQKFLDFRQNQDAVFNGAVCGACRDIFKNISK